MLDNYSRIIEIEHRLEDLRLKVVKSKLRGCGSISQILSEIISEMKQVSSNMVPQNTNLRKDLITVLDSHLTNESISNDLLADGIYVILDTLKNLVNKRDDELGISIKIPTFICNKDRGTNEK